MDQAFACILLLLSLRAALGKYVYITNGRTWTDAQAYCEDLYTDLAPVSDQEDTDELRLLSGNTTAFIWIGLERSSTNTDTWMWSGGGEVSKFFWAPGRPYGQQGSNVGLFHNNLWYDATANQALPFFCYSVVVVEEMLTWEEALQYCRENHQSLASVASETEMLLIQKELTKIVTTDHIWMGLRFLPNHWLWVDGKPLSYEAWGEGGKPTCPDVKLKCGALNVTQEAQSSSGSSAIVQVGDLVAVRHSYQGNVEADTVLSTTTSSNEAANAIQMVWEAYDCDEKLNFVCY
ncbi:macrophage mannose receptor 1-like [Betta splendens]|uniref:Macrophage mannose receptor 1-like n=1 Tax=Betta splendens TaxID=158456 RepID=A0A6P7P2E6_BETSP|nr:macrophage mannose receptor 1-like [Betta splendens]